MGRRRDGPAAILSDQVIGDPAGELDAADAFADWQQWIASSRATARQGVRCLTPPEMNGYEWAAQSVTTYRSTEAPVNRSVWLMSYDVPHFEVMPCASC